MRAVTRAISTILVPLLATVAFACGASGDGAEGSAAPGASPGPASSAQASASPAAASAEPPPDAGAGCVPSSATWQSLVGGPGQTGHDPALAQKVARYDRLHEALVTRATGLAGTITLKPDASARQKLDAFLGAPWAEDDLDPTDDLAQYAGLDAFDLVTAWGKSTGMYAGSEVAADAFRYGVLRDRGGSCTDVARVRAMLLASLDALHAVTAIAGGKGSIARSVGRRDLPGDGQIALTPLADGAGNPLPPEKNNGTWRADASPDGAYPKLAWEDSCSRDMLFGWTFAMAATWEVVRADATVPQATKDRLRADAKGILDGLRKVRPSGKDLELWDPDGRRTYHGNLHETSIDRQYILQNGVASMMALGEVAALAFVVDDAASKAYLAELTGPRALPQATTQSMSVIALGGDSSNHSAFNMLFMTAWLAERYLPDPSVRAVLEKPVRDVYAPLFGESPATWGQSFFDLVAAHAAGKGAVGVPVSPATDSNALARAEATLRGFPEAPYYARTVENCDAGEIASGTCLLNDGTTVVKLSNGKAGLLADRALPMALRPPSNFFWRTSPFLVNGAGDPNVVYPGSDLRMAYWLGRWVRRS